MNILDDLEEYTKLITSVGLPKSSKADSESKLTELSNKLNLHSGDLERLKESHEMHKNDVESKMSQMCIELELHKKDNTQSVNVVKVNSEALQKEVNDLKEYKQNVEDYKKVTNERIEKLIKLFLSINK